jgi:antitoxin (DNA-binding transcriptional repressor) of toxin-antitoxin stability system
MRDEDITPGELYRHFPDYIGRVRWAGESFTIHKRGRQLARLTSAGEIRPSKGGKRRFPRPEYRHKRITPGQFRSRMSEYLSQVRFAKQAIRIESRGKIVAIIAPLRDAQD